MIHSRIRAARHHSLEAAVASALLVLALPVLVPVAAAAPSGTVTGKIVDSNGEPLGDANVIIPDLQQGARSRGDGTYVIEGVPVGSWLLRSVRAGKKPSQKTVQVDAGRSTIADFVMAEAPYSIPVTTVRGTPATAIRIDPQTKTHVSAEKLASLPFTDLEKFIGLTAGVTTQGGELHFRGGRSNEILTIVNGVPSRNPMMAQGVELGLMAVSSSEQVLGGMDAQYGNALSGIISITTREGGDKFGGEVRYLTDRFGEEDKSFTNFERLSLGFGGPLFFPNTTYYMTFQGTYSDTYLRSVARQKEHRFLDFIRIGNKQSNSTNFSGKLAWKATPNEKVTLELLRNSSVNARYHNRWNRQGYVQVVNDSTAPSDGSITQRYGTWAWYQVDSTYVPMNTADHLPIRDEDYQQLAMAWRRVLGGRNSSVVTNLRASRQEWKTVTDVLDRQLWEYQQNANQYYDRFNRIDGAYYVTNGDYPYYERRKTVTYTLNGDVSANVRRHHFMAGGDISYNDLNYLLTRYPNVLDANGDYGATRDEFHNYNPEGSFFLQDRWEYQGMVLNAGVRYDRFSVGNQVPEDQVADPVKTQWSPRIGIAHPISDRDVMSFHYGRLFQLPDRLYIYQGRTINAEARGNANLEPETTIAYQLGLQHLFSAEVYIQFAVYFKDIYGLLSTVQQEVPGLPTTVETYVNGDYASARGFDITLIKNRSHGFSGEINYTYGNASGTASDPNRALSSRGNLRDQYKPTSETPLIWDQRHNLSAVLNLGNEKNWAASFVYEIGSGLPYTPEQRGQRQADPKLENSKRLPPSTALSLQAERFFRVWGQDVTFYLQATNLMDAKNILKLQPSLWPDNVAVNPTSYRVYYTETGRAGGAFLSADRNGDGLEDWMPVNDPAVFSEGRVVRLGLGVRF